MKLLQNDFRYGRKQSGFFEKMPIFPVELKSTYLPEDVLAIYENLGSLGEEDACVPVGKMGPALVFGHYNVASLLKSHWPHRVFQHVQIPKLQYLEISNTLQVSKDWIPHTGLWDFDYDSIQTEEDYQNFISEYLFAPRNLQTWPEGFKEHFHYMQGISPLVPLDAVEVTQKCFESVSKDLQKWYQALCFSLEDKTAFVATSNIENTELKCLLINRSGGEIENVVLCACPPQMIEEARQECTVRKKREGSSPSKEVQTPLQESIKGTLDIDIKQVESLNIQTDTPSPEILFQWILYEAIERDATDIHMEQFNERGRVRFRIDGDLSIFYEPDLETTRALVTVCKNICSMSSNAHDSQDASFSVKYNDQKVNLRVNAIPFRQGFQKLALRILPKKNSLTSLDNLGLAKDHLTILRRAINSKQGLILITGPTGEGKTTTLYAALSEINQAHLNIQTIEDPIERELEGINQTAVNLSRNVTFASLMRSIVRQDPNVILLGEIRDRESAELAIEAALTGHLVFSTLHANSATKAIQRLVQLKVPHHLIADSLILVQAQRLIKKLCRCKKVRSLTLEEEALFQKEGFKAPAQVFEAVGCSHCGHDGYSGRIAIMEIVPIDHGMSELILEQANFQKIKKRTEEKGMRSLFKDALLKVSEGTTSLKQACAFEEVWK